MSQDEIRQTVRAFLIDNIYAGIENAELKDESPLISTRIIDSIVALKLVSYLEEKFNVEFEAHEVDQDNLDTINKIVSFVQSKMK